VGSQGRHLVDVRVDSIQLTPDGDGYKLDVGKRCERAPAGRSSPTRSFGAAFPAMTSRAASSSPTSCVIDDPFKWELSGNCAYASRFAYASA
jgi:hypothetical protein